MLLFIHTVVYILYIKVLHIMFNKHSYELKLFVLIFELEMQTVRFETNSSQHKAIYLKMHVPITLVLKSDLW